MSNNEEYNNLVNLLKLFNNRPYYLAKFLLDNSTLNDYFLSILKNNDLLEKYKMKNEYFTDIEEMENYYLSFIDKMNKLYKDKDIKEITNDINIKLVEMIESEKFEEAAKIRDYMKKNNIKKL
jgi:protein-arginine kinase activator protein McsA